MTEIGSPQKRMELALEVLGLVKTQTVEPKQREYMLIDGGHAFGEYRPGRFNETLKEILKNNDYDSCQVCAQGALILAHFKMNGPFKFAEKGIVQDSKIYDILGDVFEHKQLQMIECAFEWDINLISDRTSLLTEEDKKLCREWGRRMHYSAGVKHLFESIFKNILRNDGTFRPETDIPA